MSIPKAAFRGPAGASTSKEKQPLLDINTADNPQLVGSGCVLYGFVLTNAMPVSGKYSPATLNPPCPA